MDLFKIKKFELENPKKFPEHKNMNFEECKNIVKYFSESINNEIQNTQQLFNNFLKLDNFSVDSSYNIQEILNELDIQAKEESLYIIWESEKIDKFEFDDVINYWNFFWYDVSDDAVILFLEKASIFLMVTHWDTVYYKRIDQ